MNTSAGKPTPRPQKIHGSRRERAYVVENLAALLGAGMDVLSAVAAIRSQVRSPAIKRTLATVHEELSSGAPIWRTLEQANLLPSRMLYLVRLGEESGRLPENLALIAKQQEKDRELSGKVRSAMLYPAFVMGLTIVVAIGVAWFILPRLSLVFSSLNEQLPAVTVALIGFGKFLQHWGAIVVPAVLLIFGILVYLVATKPKPRAAAQGMLLHVPGVRRVVQEIELSRFGFILGSLLEAGLPVVQALDSLRQSTTVAQYTKLYTHLKRSIEDGDSFHASLQAYPRSASLIPIPVQELVATGEQSGKLASMLLRIGAMFELKTDTSTKNLATVLEPILLVVVWAGVVGVAIAIILPIYSLIGQFNP